MPVAILIRLVALLLLTFLTMVPLLRLQAMAGHGVLFYLTSVLKSLTQIMLMQRFHSC